MTFWLQRDKWPDRPHYRHEAFPLGEDEHGLWVATPAGLPVYRGDAVVFTSRWNSVMCVAEGRQWTAWFLDPRVDDARFDTYCDIVTPLRRGATGTWCVDLDLDVVRWADGSVEIIDRDEFEQHRVLLGYPDHVAAAAERAAADVASTLSAGAGPFDGRALRWLDRSGEVCPS